MRAARCPTPPSGTDFCHDFGAFSESFGTKARRGGSKSVESGCLGGLLRRIVLLVLFILCASVLRADFLFWLDSPRGRDNPHDPARHDHDPVAGPIAPVATGLLVKVLDENNANQSGVWVMLNSDSAGAKATDAAGEANFPAAIPPVTVHLFPPAGSVTKGVGTYMGVAGPQFWVRVPYAALIQPTLTHITYNLTATAANGVVHVRDSPWSLDQIGPYTGPGPSPAGFIQNYMTLNGAAGSAYMSGLEYVGGTSTVTSAFFQMPENIVGNAATITASPGPSASGWTAAALNYNFTGVTCTTYDFQIMGGTSWIDAWSLPFVPGLLTLPSGSSNTFAYPNGASYFNIRASSLSAIGGDIYFELQRFVLNAWPASLTVNPLPSLVVTRKPTAIDMHLTASFPGGPSCAGFVAAISKRSDYSTVWSVMKTGLGSNATVDVAYPYPYPAAVTWISPFAAGLSYSATVIFSNFMGANPYLALTATAQSVEFENYSSAFLYY